MNSPRHPIEQQARALYGEAARRLDDASERRLRLARQHAVAAGEGAAHHRLRRLLLPTGAFAVLVLASLMLWQPPQRGAVPPGGMQAPSAIGAGVDADSDLPPDADKAELGLYQDLDFYGWLAANQTDGSRR